jgi:hypothetical protein
LKDKNIKVRLHNKVHKPCFGRRPSTPHALDVGGNLNYEEKLNTP